jgi:hypothetical protein
MDDVYAVGVLEKDQPDAAPPNCYATYHPLGYTMLLCCYSSALARLQLVLCIVCLHASHESPRVATSSTERVPVPHAHVQPSPPAAMGMRHCACPYSQSRRLAACSCLMLLLLLQVVGRAQFQCASLLGLVVAYGIHYRYR